MPSSGIGVGVYMHSPAMQLAVMQGMAGHAAVGVHATHLFMAGIAPATQMRLPVQPAFEPTRHGAQVFEAVSHCAAAPEQPLLSVQSTHIEARPPRPGLHCCPAAQPSVPKQSTQVLIKLHVVLTDPAQALGPPGRHTAHMPSAVHAGVEPPQSVASVATAHARHNPLSQTGLVGSAHWMAG